MTTLREAAQQALEALSCSGEPDDPGHRCGACDDYVDRNGLVRSALRAALAEEALQVMADNASGLGLSYEPVQEPVAWMVYTLDGKSVCVTDSPADFTDQHKALPLYTHPVDDTAPQRKPLTDEEIDAVCAPLGFAQLSPREVARAIERAHGIGGAV